MINYMNLQVIITYARSLVMNRFKEKFIGDKAFYKMVLTLALPILIQNGISSFVNLLDNFMVGRLGTEQLSGVSIVNQLVFVYIITMFGALSAASIFGAQFFGQKNHDGVRHTFRFKLMCCSLLTIGFIAVYYFFGGSLVDSFLHDTDSEGDLALTRIEALKYLRIMLVGLIPYMFTQIYSSTLRETGETRVPMYAGIAAVLVNLVLNALLIFGLLFFPRMGVEGAALATVISRFVEMGIVIVWTHSHKERCIFIVGAYKSMYIPATLVKQILLKGTPLLLNETLWAFGQTMLVQCYSTRGIDAVAALSIANSVANLFNIFFLALGSSISIVVGQLLGAGKLDEAVETDRKMIFFSVATCFCVGVIMFATSPLLPMCFKTTNTVRTLAASLIRAAACLMPVHAFVHASYFTLRTGGKTVITFLFDCCFLWAVNIPVAWVLSRYTVLPMFYIYLACQSLEAIKGIVGFILVKKKVWVHNIVSNM